MAGCDYHNPNLASVRYQDGVLVVRCDDCGIEGFLSDNVEWPDDEDPEYDDDVMTCHGCLKDFTDGAEGRIVDDGTCEPWCYDCRPVSAPAAAVRSTPASHSGSAPNDSAQDGER